MTREDLVEGLNSDLAAELGTIIRYTYQASKSFDKPDSLKEMLEVDLKMELQDVEDYQKHAEWADELNLVELKLKLEDMAADEAGHARGIRRIPAGL